MSDVEALEVARDTLQERARERCHCGQHSMDRPDIHGINWYWSKHTREACTLELPNVRCWCGRLRSEHIDGHAVTLPAVGAELEQKSRDTWAAYCGADAQLKASQERERIIQDHRERACARADTAEADRDQQRARADAAEARCRELESRDAPWHPFPRGTWSGVTEKEKSK